MYVRRQLELEGQHDANIVANTSVQRAVARPFESPTLAVLQ